MSLEFHPVSSATLVSGSYLLTARNCYGVLLSESVQNFCHLKLALLFHEREQVPGMVTLKVFLLLRTDALSSAVQHIVV